MSERKEIRNLLILLWLCIVAGLFWLVYNMQFHFNQIKWDMVGSIATVIYDVLTFMLLSFAWITYLHSKDTYKENKTLEIKKNLYQDSILASSFFCTKDWKKFYWFIINLGKHQHNWAKNWYDDRGRNIYTLEGKEIDSHWISWFWSQVCKLKCIIDIQKRNFNILYDEIPNI